MYCKFGLIYTANFPFVANYKAKNKTTVNVIIYHFYVTTQLLA
jgi:hypothetical protein